MTYKFLQYPRKASIGYGAIGGFVAGIVMMGVAMSTTVMIGMPYDTIPKAIGTAFGASLDNLLIIGLGMHLLTSALVGIIFGIVTGNVKKLQITGFGKGVGLGLIAGIMAFIIISLPVSSVVLPPILVKFMVHMHPDMTQEMAMTALQQKKTLIMSTAIIRHLVYGVILGTIVTIIVRRSQKSEK